MTYSDLSNDNDRKEFLGTFFPLAKEMEIINIKCGGAIIYQAKQRCSKGEEKDNSRQKIRTDAFIMFLMCDPCLFSESQERNRPDLNLE